MAEDDFLRAIADNPQDMAPRLIFTDWLRENGADARADFIQIQVRHRTGSLPHTFSMRARTIDELLAYPIWDRMHKRTTIPIVLRVANSGARWIEYRGGFVCRLRCPWHEVRRNGTHWVQKYPLENFELDRDNGDLERACQWLGSSSPVRAASAGIRVCRDLLERFRDLAGLAPLRARTDSRSTVC